MPQRPKLTEVEVIKIHHKAWLGVDSNELAKKYNVCEATIRSIKHGKIHSKLTGHVPGTVPDFIIKRKPPRTISEDERKARRDAVTKEVLEEYAGIMKLDDYFIQLVDENVESAIEFKVLFRQMRNEKGLSIKRFTIEEVNEFYEEFKNGMIMNDN
jgi:hypothetical protein